MILSDKDIKKALADKYITIDPLFPNAIQLALVGVLYGKDA